MILVLCNDDPRILQDAQNQQGAPFGMVYQFITQNTPVLGQAEKLFITAHGLAGEIGNESGSLGYGPVELYNYLTCTTPNDLGQSLFPAGYTGNIYISACYSANVTRSDRLSFIEQFNAVSNVDLPNTLVYGNLGGVCYQIPQPNDPSWQRAVI